MATTKIWSVRGWLGQVVQYVENPDKTENPRFSEADLQGLRDVMDYATSDFKTEQQHFVSGVNCMPAIARQQMQMTKRRFSKEGGIVAFHAYQSFKPGEVTPEEAHNIGLALAQTLWGARFEVVVATHLNTGCMHNHFVLNSVSFADGKRYNDCKRTYRALREASDRLCRERGCSVIEHPASTRTPRGIYLAEKAGRPTAYNVMRADIDTAIAMSMTRQQFGRHLRSMGYELSADPRRKYATIHMPGRAHPTRLKTLGDDYTEDAIDRRILANKRPTFPPPQPPPHVKIYRFRGIFELEKAKGIGGLRGLYLHYCYRLGILPKGTAHKPLHPALKADLLRMEAIAAQARLLAAHHIDTAEQLAAFVGTAKAQVQTLTAQRTGIYNKLRRCTDVEAIAGYRARRDELSRQLAALRKDLKSARGVEERSGMVRENIALEREALAKRDGRFEKKKAPNERQR